MEKDNSYKESLDKLNIDWREEANARLEASILNASNKTKRISREDYYMKLAQDTSLRATCRISVGAVAIKDNRIILTGFNGSLKGHEHCLDIGCNMVNGHCLRTIHAEQNIIAQAAKEGISLKDTIIYVTHQPCFYCMKMMIAAGINSIVFENSKEDPLIPAIYYHDIKVYQYPKMKRIYK